MTSVYSTYLTYWDNDPYTEVQDMIAKKVILPTTRIILAFASFNFASPYYIPGLGSLTLQQVQQLVELVHSVDATISLSIGGATYPFAGSDLYAQPGVLANNINQIVTTCQLDGIDFDIEDNAATVPSNFANQAASLINTLRNLNPTLLLTLTTAAQAWAPGTYQLPLLNLTIGNLTAWQPMEYDLWVDPSFTYAAQIQYDINYYLTTWGVNPSKLILGLMPGRDDTSKDLTLQDALNLTAFAKEKGLQGVMTWDVNNDGKGCDGNAPYAYSMGIQSMLSTTEQKFYRNQSKKRMDMPFMI
jgi:hypothetical protein